ncbi:Potassium channel sub K member 1 [Tyrophagus putrescentiae]|nr:Potassium channel sub K member 1 [Tyrophagus putrescentiae]
MARSTGLRHPLDSASSPPSPTTSTSSLCWNSHLSTQVTLTLLIGETLTLLHYDCHYIALEVTASAMASGSRRVEFDRNVQTLGQSWTSSMASTSAGSMASTSTAEHYQQRNNSSSPVSTSSSGESLPADRQSPYFPGNYQSYHHQNGNDIQTFHPSQIEYYEEDDDDDFSDSYSLYLNQNSGGGGGYSEAHSKLDNGALIHSHNAYHHPHHHIQPIPTTLYRNGSVSIVNSKDLKQFVRSIMTANDKGVNLAKLNELIDLQEAKQRNDSLRAEMRPPPPPCCPRRKRAKRATGGAAGGKTGKKYPSAASDASIQINKHVKPIRVPVEMANWEFFSSLNYVTTVVTTIGYGHVTPVTEEGKILTLVFGAIAIPATLLFFSVIISAIRDGPVKIVEIWLIKFFSHFTQITLLKIRFIHLILITFILFLTLILLPSFIFLQLEPDWTFLDSFYYCFITITTVGLGDYVPAQSVALIDSRPFYLLGTVLYMYFGLCMIMLWIALVLRIPYFNFKTFLVIEEPEISEEKIPDESTALLAGNSTHTYTSVY